MSAVSKSLIRALVKNCTLWYTLFKGWVSSGNTTLTTTAKPLGKVVAHSVITPISKEPVTQTEVASRQPR